MKVFKYGWTHRLACTPEALVCLSQTWYTSVVVGLCEHRLKSVDGALGVILFSSPCDTFVPLRDIPMLNYWCNLAYHESLKYGNYLKFGDWRVEDDFIEYKGQRVALCHNFAYISTHPMTHFNMAESDIYPLIALSMINDKSQLW